MEMSLEEIREKLKEMGSNAPDNNGEDDEEENGDVEEMANGGGNADQGQCDEDNSVLTICADIPGKILKEWESQTLTNAFIKKAKTKLLASYIAGYLVYFESDHFAVFQKLKEAFLRALLDEFVGGSTFVREASNASASVFPYTVVLRVIEEECDERAVNGLAGKLHKFKSQLSL